MKDIKGVYENELDLSTMLDFGKYKGYTVKEVADFDKKYLHWLFGDTNFLEDHSVAQEVFDYIKF